MNLKSLLLSSDWLKNITIGENDFVFKFGEYEIKMNSILAEFISPLVSQLHRSDRTANSIHFEIPEKIGFFNLRYFYRRNYFYYTSNFNWFIYIDKWRAKY